MSVERAHAERIAALARLHFEPAELTRITEELNHILEHVEALRALEPPGAGEGGSARSGPSPSIDEAVSTRGEAAESPDPLGLSLEALAPDWRDGFFVVPPLPGVREDDGA
jgi:Asp-tRNA(Asn)/Glu-tRNA(Gln) amidotransferase C subunit